MCIRDRAHIHSYGCQQNVSDGEKIKGMLAEIGYDFTERREEADLVIYNLSLIHISTPVQTGAAAGAPSLFPDFRRV